VGRRLATLAVAATLALLGSVLVAPAAHAVETDAVRTEAVAAFNDGNWGWYKLVLEKNLSTFEGRVKITVWCEPDNVAGGTKVPCDAVAYGHSPIPNTGHLSAEWWWDNLSRWETSYITMTTSHVDYSPPSAGYSIATGWSCSGHGLDDYRAYVASFTMASSNQWAQWRSKATPTWRGELCTY
jgi:hypothetical protein